MSDNTERKLAVLVFAALSLGTGALYMAIELQDAWPLLIISVGAAFTAIAQYFDDSND